MTWRSVKDDPPPRECRRPKLAGSYNHPGIVGDIPPKVVHQVRVFCHTHWQYIDWPPADNKIEYKVQGKLRLEGDTKPPLVKMRIQGELL